MRNGSRAWPRSQYRNAPSPQAYSSHHQQQPSLRRLGLIVVSGPLYSHGKKPASPNHAVHLLPLSHSLGTHTKPPGGQTIATSPLSNISTACSRSKRSCFNPRTTDTKSLPFPGLQFRCPRNGRQFTPRLSFPEVSPPSLGAACRHLTTVPPRIEAGAAAEVPPGSCLP